jgi:hypothetical protein
MERKELYLPITPSQKSPSRLRPCQLIDDPPVSKQKHDRYAPHIKTPCKRRVFLGIDLNDGRLSRQQFRHFSHRRCE